MWTSKLPTVPPLIISAVRWVGFGDDAVAEPCAEPKLGAQAAFDLDRVKSSTVAICHSFTMLHR